MLSIRHRQQNYQVLFKSEPVTRLGKRKFENVEVITCVIVGNNLRTHAIGIAVRAEQDLQDDSKGAELALGRALQRLTENKELRAKFWDAFWDALNRLPATRGQVMKFPFAA